MKGNDIALKLFVVMSRANHAITDAIKLDIKSHGLNPTEFAVLELLYHKGDVPLQKIGEKILLASGSITYVVDKLEGKGYLQRLSCPKDRRITYAVITEQGKQLMDEIFPKHEAKIAELFSVFSEDEQVQLISAFKKLGYHAEEKK
ncbi:MarR family transcriptional regulator [Bacillus tianshenii]|nr:MarR family transcriptional regulator [Bacillus tianshenii]